MIKADILLIEDDEEFRYLIGEKLQAEGFRVLKAGDGAAGMLKFSKREPDLILLDIMMPGMNGFEVCRRIRKVSDVPIIMLTCRASEMEIVCGLETGADDYVAKTSGMTELVARIRAVLRRRHYLLSQDSPMRIDDRLAFRRTQREIVVDGQAVDLSAIEFKLLQAFLDSPNCVLTYQNLLTQVWGWEYADEIDYLRVYVYNLRKKIERDPAHPEYIVTERGMGYRLHMPAAG
jgi:DNA-binding response OmpR family regulator